MDKQILVVIPYLAQGAQGNELELAVTGWRKHFAERHLIVVVGDRDDMVSRLLEDGEGLVTDFMFISCPRIEPVPGQYLPHLDMVHKFRKVREFFPRSDGFIYTCDDIYATADFTMGDVLQPKEPVRGFSFEPWDTSGQKLEWYTDKGKTGMLCLKEGLPVRNWICHLPVYYNWNRLFEIYDRYDCDHQSYIVENIYFNMMYPDDPNAAPEREYHDEVTTSSPDIRPVGSVKWVSNANSGWSRRLEAMLREHYESIHV